MIQYFPRTSYQEFARAEGCIGNRGMHTKPEWLCKLPIPSGCIGYNVDQVGCFMWAWDIRQHFEKKFYPFSLDNGQADDLTEKLSRGSVLLILPFGGWLAENELMRTTREKAERAGVVVVPVPMNIARGEPWPIEMSMCISTRIEIAKRG